MNDWVLRILSGPHRNAEIALAPGDYRVGSDEADDLVLQDSGLRPAHFQLRIDDDGAAIRLLATETPLNIDGETQAATDIAIAALAVFSLGKLQFALGKPDDDWSRINPAEPHNSPPAPRPDATVAGRKQRGKKGAAAVFGSAGISVMFLVLFLQSGQPMATARPAPLTPLEQWREIGAQMDIRQLQLLVTDQGHKIKGYVASRQELDKLHSLIDMIGLQVNQDIMVVDAIIDGAQRILQEHGLNDFSVAQSGEYDVFSIEGVAADEIDWVTAFDAIRRDVQGVSRWQTKVTFAQQAQKPAPAISLGFAIRSIHIGRTPFIVADNGQKYSEGSRLTSGYMIRKITTDAVDVERHGQTVSIPVAER